MKAKQINSNPESKAQPHLNPSYRFGKESYKPQFKSNFDLIEFPPDYQPDQQKEMLENQTIKTENKGFQNPTKMKIETTQNVLHVNKKKKSKQKRANSSQRDSANADGSTQQRGATRKVVKILQLKNLEVLVIGGPKVGKTAIVKSLLNLDIISSEVSLEKEKLSQEQILVQASVQEPREQNLLATIKEVEQEHFASTLDQNRNSLQIQSMVTPSQTKVISLQAPKNFIRGDIKTTENQKKPQRDCGVGMEIHKQEQICRSGETVRLCLWDPTISMIPKERATKNRNKLAADKKKKDKAGVLNSLIDL